VTLARARARTHAHTHTHRDGSGDACVHEYIRIHNVQTYV
jgi:hypothetical protein